MQPTLSMLLARLCTVLNGQAEALGADDFARLEHLCDDRDRLVALLDGYSAKDASPTDRELMNQISALDQRLSELHG